MWQQFTNKVRRAFSEAADQYDILASLQREIGRELVKKYLKLNNVERILDVGCGTGYVAAKAKFFYPESDIVGVDMAQGMLEKALEQHEHIRWLAGDAHNLPLKDQSFDWVVSNLAYQWAFDFPKAMLEVKRVLKPGGIFTATMFGHHTLDELFQSLEATGGPASLNRLPKVEDVQKTLRASGFSNLKADYERIQIQFKDLRDLLGWLKAIGANGLSQGHFLGPKALEAANQYCLKNFPYHEGVRMTFEVIWIEARE